MMQNSRNFFSDLDIHDLPLSELISDREKFCDLPEDWHIIVSDIRNSTLAIQENKHNEVNLVATGCVIAVLNIAEDSGIAIPFFFGGDGAIFIIPEELLHPALSALQKHSQNTLKNFGFELSIGSFSIKEIYRKDIELKISRAKVNNKLNIPVIMGNGLQYAEDEIKNQSEPQRISPSTAKLNLKGMECKWDKIKPPKEDQEVVSLIVAGCGHEDYSKVYATVMRQIDEIYGSHGNRKPISVEKLKINAGLQRINDEMKFKLGKWDLLTFIKSLILSNFGEFYLKNTKRGKSYLKRLVELTDNLSIDGRINTVITGTIEQRKALIEKLDHLEQANKIKYGYHTSSESIMSCYVKDMQTEQHIHFVDGGNGGYTKAANQLKSKFTG
ncbi:DUF3095 family protein [Christiangramia salexigens]|uniref:DUF3095 domain-containing protein n=1 Tax=Christiangramia salexigens TaxID=1913577 RepID=A0A1L3J6D1_9FLAO|nr:DUF3095 family protein [Christiangramia salexigens]APG60682.1 hypothetical protein LPB144_09830 [Christiangramia salexigens]